jgi:hypothetical protein
MAVSTSTGAKVQRPFATVPSLGGEYRTDYLVVAFEQSIGQNPAREGVEGLTKEERSDKRIPIIVETSHARTRTAK